MIREDGLEKLKRLDIREMSEQTKMSITKLDAILNKKFDKLEKVSTLGFIKLLEKEYGVNLEKLSSELEEHFQSIKKDEVPKESILTWEDNDKKNGIGNVITALIISAIVALIAYMIMKPSAIEEITKKIEPAKTEQNTIKEDMSQPIQKESEQVAETLVKIDENLSSTSETEESIISQNTTNDTQTGDINSSESVKPDIKDEELFSAVIQNSAAIIPKERLWIGVIFFDGSQRVNTFMETEYKLNKTKEQLVVTGKGTLSLKIDETKKDYLSPNPIRFHIKDGKIRQIKYEEFIQINGGVVW